MAIKRPPERLFDIRMYKRLIERGEVDRKDYDKFVQDLPDLSDQHDVTEVALEPVDTAGPQR